MADEDPVLFSGEFTEAGDPYYKRCSVTITEQWLAVDSYYSKRKCRRTLELPITEIVAVEVDAISGERSEYGWNPATGFLHGAKKVRAATGLLIVTRDGTRRLFRFSGAPIELRAAMGSALSMLEHSALTADAKKPPGPVAGGQSLR